MGHLADTEMQEWALHTHSLPPSPTGHDSHSQIHTRSYSQSAGGFEMTNKELLSALLLLALATQVAFSSPLLLPTAMRLAGRRDKWRSDSVSIDTGALLQRLLQKPFTCAIVLEDNGAQIQIHAPLVDVAALIVSAERCF